MNVFYYSIMIEVHLRESAEVQAIHITSAHIIGV